MTDGPVGPFFIGRKSDEAKSRQKKRPSRVVFCVADRVLLVGPDRAIFFDNDD